MTINKRRLYLNLILLVSLGQLVRSDDNDRRCTIPTDKTDDPDEEVQAFADSCSRQVVIGIENRFRVKALGTSVGQLPHLFRMGLMVNGKLQSVSIPEVDAEHPDSVWRFYQATPMNADLDINTDPDYTHSRISIKRQRPIGDTQEYTISWSLAKADLARRPELCILYEAKNNDLWYATYITPTAANYPLSPLIDADPSVKQIPAFTPGVDPLGSIFEYLFVSSAGFALALDPLTTWHIRQPSAMFCLSSSSSSEILDESRPLRLRLLAAESVTAAHRAAVTQYGYIRRPPAHPPTPLSDSELVWSVTLPMSLADDDLKYLDTRIGSGEADDLQAHANNNQQMRLLFVNQTASRPDLSSWVEMDIDKFGDERRQVFGDIKFIMSIGPTVSSAHEAEFRDARQAKALLISGDSTADDREFLIDFTNPAAVDWYRDLTLEFIDDTNAGLWFAYNDLLQFVNKSRRELFDEMIRRYPSFMLARYAEFVDSVAHANRWPPNVTFVEAGYRTQHLNDRVWCRLRLNIDMMSNAEDPVTVLISNVLALSLGGYQLFVAEWSGEFPPKRVAELALTAIGRTKPNDADEDAAELFVRLMQATIFMPSLFSPVAPWTLQRIRDERFKTLSKLTVVNALDVRRRIYQQRIDRLWTGWIERGEPILCPVWYHADTSASLTVTDEYMLGDDVLVAPLVRQTGQMNHRRIIYLPPGRWSPYVEFIIQDRIDSEPKLNLTNDPPYFDVGPQGLQLIVNIPDRITDYPYVWLRLTVSEQN